MVYATTHKLLTYHGTMWRLATNKEQWSIGFRLLNLTSTAVSQAQANAADTLFRTVWNGTSGLWTDSNDTYDFCKIAEIGVNGRYVDGTQAFESVHTSLNGRASSALGPLPSQCAVAVTLTSSKPGGRGRASKGRVYLPHPGTTIGTNGQLSAGTQDIMRDFVKNVITAINADGTLGNVAIMSKVGTGLTYNVVSVKCGSVVDTIRRRRRQLPETYDNSVTV